MNVHLSLSKSLLEHAPDQVVWTPALLLVQQLEDELDAELDVTRQVSLLRNPTKVRTGWVKVRVVELRVVTGVDKLTAQFKVYRLGEENSLDHREVQQVERLTAEAGDAQREVTDIAP